MSRIARSVWAGALGLTVVGVGAASIAAAAPEPVKPMAASASVASEPSRAEALQRELDDLLSQIAVLEERASAVPQPPSRPDSGTTTMPSPSPQPVDPAPVVVAPDEQDHTDSDEHDEHEDDDHDRDHGEDSGD